MLPLERSTAWRSPYDTRSTLSAILGVTGGNPLPDGQVHAMLERMGRGSEHVEIWREQDTVLAAGRYTWELDATFSGPALIAHDDRYVVAADASIYYRAELRKALESCGIVAASDTAPHLVLAALRAWGATSVERLDGDFAFIAWDRRERVMLCARDIAGKRPLHYARLGREFVAASTIRGVVSHPRCPDDLNVPVIGGCIAGFHFSAGPETAYRAVEVLPNAHWLTWSDRRVTGPVRYWNAPVDSPVSRVPFEEAAEHLRETLETAIRERLQTGAVNTVWMSGGWDSTAVFGAGQHAIHGMRDGTDIVPVSISYPEGDPGREDDWIESIAMQWDRPVHWIDIADIPLLDREPEHAAGRDEPYAHVYTHWNTALARGTRACGSRIALDGNGGDQLFANSDMFLADLFRRGQWLALAHEWPSRPRGGYRQFFSTVIQPNLSDGMLDLAARLRGGRPLKPYLARPLPQWIEPAFAARHGIEARDSAYLGRPEPGTHAGREIDFMFTSLFVARAFSLLGTMTVRSGVELRSPLSDRRVIDLALSRPWWERSSGRETKRLLRRSMKGLLPDDVLAPRQWRTGITGGYSHRWMSERFPPLLEQTMADGMLLEEMGIVRADVLRRACAGYPRRRDAATRIALFQTLQTELWLRAIRDSTADTTTQATGPADSRRLVGAS